MDKRHKMEILLAINDITVEDLFGMIQSGDITKEEMIANNLNANKILQIQALQSKVVQSKITEEDMIATCREIENGKLDSGKIKKLFIEGAINEELVLRHTSLTPEMIAKIRNYQKQVTPFLSWKDLPPLQKGNTDLYFFGMPGSGKSCILASLFYYMDKQAMVNINNNAYNPEGTKYRLLLKDEISYGILPESTAEEGVNYIPINLKNNDNNENLHPLNFIEMSGELFKKAYEQGINDNTLAARNYLNNTNRKLIYFVVDYDQHVKSRTVSSGASQSSIMEFILAQLDEFGTFKNTDGLYIIVTKSDLFPPGTDRYDYALEFLESNYKSFIANCKDLQKKYKNTNKFDITVYPYSIGEVKFQNMLIQFDMRSPKELIEDILNDTFRGPRNNIFRQLFGK